LYGYDPTQDSEIQETFNTLVAAGINFIDSADSYGTGKFAGRAEKLVGKFLQECPSEQNRQGFKVFTKFAPYPWRMGKGSITKACDEALERVGRPALDVAQLHWRPPLGWQEQEYFMALSELVETGRAKTVGLSNYGTKQLGIAHGELGARGVPLVSNQVQFSLLSRIPQQSGLLDLCSDLSVTPIAYSPLGLGLLTGKYTLSSIGRLPPGPRGSLFRQILPTMGPLLGTLADIQRTRGKTCSQVAINWTIAKGSLPLVGVRTPQQAQENLGALGWLLSSAEVDELDRAAAKCKVQLPQNIFQTK
jgi:pyridoxine 4-dehydrogenase